VPDAVELKKQLLNVEKKMELLLSGRIKNYREKVKSYENANVLRNPMNIIDDKRMNILHIEKNLSSRIKLILSEKKSQFMMGSSKLEALNPLSVLTRGYSVAYKDDKILHKINDVELNENISVKLSDGFVDATVVNKRKVVRGNSGG